MNILFTLRTKLIFTTFLIVLTILFVSFKTGKLNVKNKGYYKLASSVMYNGSSSDSVFVSGNIFDLKSQKALPYSVFSIKDTKIGSMVDACGHFEIKIKGGTFNFIFACVGNMDLVSKKITVDSKNKYHFVVYLDSFSLYEKK